MQPLPLCVPSSASFLSLAFIVFTVRTGKIISYGVIIPEFIYGDLDNGAGRCGWILRTLVIYAGRTEC